LFFTVDEHISKPIRRVAALPAFCSALGLAFLEVIYSCKSAKAGFEQDKRCSVVLDIGKIKLEII
jgi:hypothetical protein